MQPISWDIGTGYDLFASLYILHHPAMFGLRPAWAAGVRSRLPTSHREFLQRTFSFLSVPMAWLNGLQSQSKNAAAVLAALAELAPAERLTEISFSSDISREAWPILDAIRASGKWQASELEALRSIYQRNRITQWPGMFPNLCDAWIKPAEFGERLLETLDIYCQLFFYEEEKRITPVIQDSLQSAQQLGMDLSAGELVERLSKGLKLDLVAAGIVLIPSFWAGPIVFVNKLTPDGYILLFGGRRENQGIIPGEEVPQPLLAALKALADPTRLLILKNLVSEQRTLTELSRLVHLRPPTVLHHLYALRLAELVQITFLANGERRYTLRREALGGVQEALYHFLISAAPE